MIVDEDLDQERISCFVFVQGRIDKNIYIHIWRTSKDRGLLLLDHVIEINNQTSSLNDIYFWTKCNKPETNLFLHLLRNILIIICLYISNELEKIKVCYCWIMLLKLTIKHLPLTKNPHQRDSFLNKIQKTRNEFVASAPMKQLKLLYIFICKELAKIKVSPCWIILLKFTIKILPLIQNPYFFVVLKKYTRRNFSIFISRTHTKECSKKIYIYRNN